MGYTKNNDPKVSLRLPNLTMIPILSLIFSLIKLCGGTSWSWITVIFVAPSLFYMAWSIFLIAITLSTFLIFKTIKRTRKVK